MRWIRLQQMGTQQVLTLALKQAMEALCKQMNVPFETVAGFVPAGAKHMAGSLHSNGFALCGQEGNTTINGLVQHYAAAMRGQGNPPQPVQTGQPPVPMVLPGIAPSDGDQPPSMADGQME